MKHVVGRLLIALLSIVFVADAYAQEPIYVTLRDLTPLTSSNSACGTLVDPPAPESAVSHRLQAPLRLAFADLDCEEFVNAYDEQSSAARVFNVFDNISSLLRSSYIVDTLALDGDSPVRLKIATRGLAVRNAHEGVHVRASAFGIMGSYGFALSEASADRRENPIENEVYLVTPINPPKELNVATPTPRRGVQAPVLSEPESVPVKDVAHVALRMEQARYHAPSLMVVKLTRSQLARLVAGAPNIPPSLKVDIFGDRVSVQVRSLDGKSDIRAVTSEGIVRLRGETELHFQVTPRAAGRIRLAVVIVSHVRAANGDASEEPTTFSLDPLLVEASSLDYARVFWLAYWQYLLTLPVVGALARLLAMAAEHHIRPPRPPIGFLHA